MNTKMPLLPLVLLAAGAGWLGALASRSAALGRHGGAALAPVATERQTAVPAAIAARMRRLDHDLRTPIGTVATALDLLRAGGTGAAGPDEETMQVLERQVARLTGIADALRDLAEASSRPGD